MALKRGVMHSIIIALHTTTKAVYNVLIHLVNPYKVLNNWVSKFITAITYLSESLYILSALSTLLGRYVRYIRLQYYTMY